MAYSGDPAASTADQVRFLLGDTSDTPYLNDDEVDFLVAMYDKPLRAAYEGAMALCAKFAAKRDQTIGSTSVSYQSLYDRYSALARDLARRGGKSTLAAAPFAGGMAGTQRSDGTPIEMEMGVDWTNRQRPV